MKTTKNQYPEGTKVRINGRHHGCKGSTGRVTVKAPTFYRTNYWAVRLTGGKASGMTRRFSASEMVKIEA